jgi:hypothetical protein
MCIPKPTSQEYVHHKLHVCNLSSWTEHFGIYLHKNQQMNQNYHFIVMLSQMLLHNSVHHCHHQGAHMILTSYLSVYITERIMEYRVK